MQTKFCCQNLKFYDAHLTTGTPRSLQILRAKLFSISVCLGISEPPIVYSTQDCTTTNADALPAAAHSRSFGDAGAILCVSYGEGCLLKTLSSGFNRLTAVELQRFLQRYLERIEQFRFRPLLAIDAWKLFNPAYPPRARLLYHCGVRLFHGIIFRCRSRGLLLVASLPAEPPVIPGESSPRRSSIWVRYPSSTSERSSSSRRSD